MRNKYGGICYRCGKQVTPGDGHFEKVDGSQARRWGASFTSNFILQHANCAILWRGTDRHYRFNPIELPRTVQPATPGASS